jgi:dienelactone hydrolase
MPTYIARRDDTPRPAVIVLEGIYDAWDRVVSFLKRSFA